MFLYLTRQNHGVGRERDKMLREPYSKSLENRIT